MKQYLSFLHLSNLLGSKMKKGVKNFCNGDDSTSTLDQHYNNNTIIGDGSDQHYTCMHSSTKGEGRSPTLEEMILQLELEEEMARRAKLSDNIGMRPGRMSCVNSSDILRSARNALNQYPRFSLDGKDAMYRASFRGLDAASVVARGRRSLVGCENKSIDSKKLEKKTLFGIPKTLGGESVVWCKPGVVAQLMGLEEVPVPLSSFRTKGASKERVANGCSVAMMRRQNLRRRAERHEMERKLAMNNHTNGSSSSSSKPPGYSVMKPIVAHGEGEGGWPTRRFY